MRENEKENPRETNDNTIAPHSLTDTQLIPKQLSGPSGQLPPVYDEYGVQWNGIPAVLDVLPPHFLYSCFLAEHGTLKSSYLE